MNKGKITVIIANLFVIVMLSYLLLNLLTIPLISPGNKAYMTDRRPSFAWGGMQGEYTLYLDDNSKFKTPIAVRMTGNSYVPESDMDFGTYYWKVESGPFSSGAAKFTLGSSVVLSRTENDIKNEGNTELKVSGLGGGITGLFILGINESFEIEGNENVMAEQA
jgi:hypothetical protein